ncbi:MAG: hypothetical protein IJS65_05760 [Clostridia bacterium]|nr:hypothetical protein [Clostridia bacterium]
MSLKSKKENKQYSKETQALIVDFRTSSILLVISVAVVLIAAFSLAWFAFNNSVVSGALTVNLNDTYFDLGVQTTAGARTTPVGATPLSVLDSLLTRSYSSTALETSNGQGDVICALLTSDGNPIRPGSEGTLVFRVLPKAGGLTFIATGEYSGIKKVVDVEHSTITYEFMDPANDADDALALELLKGHLLFFTSSTYSASNRVDIDDGFYITGATDTTEEYLVTLYWTWPRVYDDHEVYVDSSWESTHTFLHNGVGEIGYNRADQVIGEAISYVVMEVGVEVAQDASGSIPSIAATVIP